MKTTTKIFATAALSICFLAPASAQDNTTTVNGVLSNLIKQAIETASTEIESQIDTAILSISKDLNTKSVEVEADTQTATTDLSEKDVLDDGATIASMSQKSDE